MQRIDNKYIFLIILILMLTGCKTPERSASEAAEQAAKFADTASAEVEAAQDATATIKAAEITLQALNKLIEAIVVTPNMSITADAQEKFEAVRFQTIRQLHSFIVPESHDCKSVLNILLKLDSKVKNFACRQRGEDDFLGCQFDRSTQQCKCSRNSAGTCPNNKECILLPDDTCQCSKC
ncbi:MAG: hypothetical protein ABFS56_05425 [Pseudomonadota bacterium]